MPVSSKHIATFLLGAAAGVAALKYMNLSDEEKANLTATLKEKAESAKDKAEEGLDKLKEYFETLRSKGGDALKDVMADAEKAAQDLFNKKPTTDV